LFQIQYYIPFNKKKKNVKNVRNEKLKKENTFGAVIFVEGVASREVIISFQPAP